MSAEATYDQATAPLDTVDPLDLHWHVDGPPQELFARLRAEMPVQRLEGPEDAVWSLTLHADISAVSRDTATFSSHEKGVFLRRDAMLPLEAAQQVLLMKDPPDHTKYRLVLQNAFTPATVAKLEESVRARVTRIVDSFVEKGGGDFVEEVAVPVSLGVLLEVMGAPDEDFRQWYEWTEATEANQRKDEDGANMAVMAEIGAYLTERIPALRASTEDTIVKRMLDGQVDGRPLNDIELLLFFGLLSFAGNDTTRNTASTGMLALMHHPDQWAYLQANPETAKEAVEEILRWTTVVNWFTRTVMEETEIRGQAIPQGDRVLMWYTSASRDEDVYTDPQTFDLSRASSEHKAFGGGGRHFCLGAGLARLELRLMFEEVVKRAASIEPDGQVERLGSNWANGLHHFPVTVKAR